ncbi:hypothetical protein H310_13309 [Aphanomyces invadans]|uniref:Sugar phosphate transporter domain-containing protein n=1 Tax=Aphanomyces invadans TaxID=157072 RepID=A0A024TFT3_9STRA|nr:hypothetical protein H310_13309 [Aphanomyces invadans]ETV92431.1 hypothetical protein H310_13309 [Aphanomyces invadans]|eukprot:XP_008878982.1 hypothetical protein H310_13309 [Aphanomyces invadans]
MGDGADVAMSAATDVTSRGTSSGSAQIGVDKAKYIAKTFPSSKQQAADTVSLLGRPTSSSADATPSVKSTVFLLLLALQIGIQPELMKWYAKDATNVALRITVIGLLKVVVALVPLLWNGEWRREFSTWSFRIALRTTVLPALIYSVQDYLNQTAVVLLDGVTYNVLNQTKIIWTALLVYWMLGKKQSGVQVLALVALVASAVLIAVGGQHDKQPTDDRAASSLEGEALRITGMGRAAFAAVLSAFAGTIIQKALQKEARNAYMVTLELSVINIACCLWSSMAHAMALSSADASIPVEPTASMWVGWSFMTFVTLLVQALGGVLVGFVIKYSGNIKKSFAVVGGLLLTAACESIVNETAFGLPGYLSTALVTGSTLLYTNFPPRATPSTTTMPPPKKDDSIESTGDDTTESSSGEEDSGVMRVVAAA